MAFQENQFRANIEFLRSTSGRSRIIKLNHRPDVVPPQLAFRLHPAFWAAFMADVGQLSLHHPYSQSPKAKDMCTWAACFGLGAVVGLFCISPDAGDYGVWEADCRRLIDTWAPGFAQAGCQLSLQRHRDYWIQIDVPQQAPPPQPVAPPLPQPAFPPMPAGGAAAPAAGAATAAAPRAAGAPQQQLAESEPLKPPVAGSAQA